LRTSFLPRAEVLEDRTAPATIAYSVPAGTVGQQAFGGPLGLDFDVVQPIAITRLGVFDSGSDGLSVPLVARVYNRVTQTELAEISFPAGTPGQLIGGSRFLPLATPLLLAPGFHGSIVAEGYGPTEGNGNGFFQTITWTTDNGGGLINFVGGGRNGDTPGVYPPNLDGGPANRYAAGTFEYLSLAQFVSGATSVNAGQGYALNLNLPQATGLSGWTVNWGDGHTDSLAGNPSQASHTYSASGNYSIAATALDGSGHALGTDYRAVTLSAGPSAWWRLDDTAPTVAQDAAGGNAGQYVNFGAADLGQAGAVPNDPTSSSVHFNGGDYVSLPSAPFGNYPTAGATTQYALTFSAWFKTSAAGVILGQTDSSGVPGGASPGGWVPAIYIGTSGRVFSSLFYHGGGVPNLFSPDAYNNNVWHQVAVVYGSGVETLYVDGSAVAAQSAPVVGYAAAYHYFLGAGFTSGWPFTFGGWSYFNGQLDEAAVYPTALTPQQVAAGYLAGVTAQQSVSVLATATTPVVHAGPDATAAEGGTFTGTGSFTDSAFESPWNAFVDYGDGTGDGPTFQPLPLNGTSFSLSHQYLQPGMYTVTVMVINKDGKVGTGTLTVTVTNLPPVVTAPADQTGLEGAAQSFNLGSFDDPGVFDNPWSVDVNWGDGSAHGTFSTGFRGNLSPLSHAYADNGTYTVTVSVTDNGGMTGTATFHAAIGNQPPVVTAPADQSAVAGLAASFNLGSFTDAGTLDSPWAVDVNWGDGSAHNTFNALAPGALTSLTHTYANAGTFTATVSVTDKDGASGAATFQVGATGPPTAAIAGPAEAVRGQLRPYIFSATDPSPAAQAAGFTYQIIWGDGSPVEVIAAAPGNGAGVTRSHLYKDSGSDTIQVTATDSNRLVSPPAAHAVQVVPWQVQLQRDPANPAHTIHVLVVGGSTGPDDITVDEVAHGSLRVSMFERATNSHTNQTFTAALDRIVVYGQEGDDSITISQRIGLTAELYGGDGNDTLTGGGGDNILVGGAGNDTLYGGSGRNLLISGAGNGLVIGGGSDDILIAGRTDFDTNEAALRALLFEWESSADYLTRVHHLDGSLAGGLNGSYFLNADTVHRGGNSIRLYGAAGRDWFFAALAAQTPDRRADELRNAPGN
jgi:PKD repeat protein